MILKGGAVGGGGLAAHLRSEENDSVEIVQAEGLLSRDIAGAVAELRARGVGITAKPVFHTAISAAPGQKWGEAEQRQAVAAFVKEFGLEGVPLLVVRHQKDAQGVGRDDHLHVVASRIDERGRVISDAFTRVRHEKVARCLEHTLGHPLTIGKHNRAVMAALRREGRADVADWMAAAGAHTAPRP
ncbi:MAG TPA: hypothetical protein VK558_02410, partial [Patescibacteria group bacterium]|nr:hypothetical protein [Patescibacteria group bacterium]